MARILSIVGINFWVLLHINSKRVIGIDLQLTVAQIVTKWGRPLSPANPIYETKALRRDGGGPPD